MIAAGVDELVGMVGTRGACTALAVPRASHYRRLRGPRLGPPLPRPASPRALSEPERAAVLGELHSPRFLDASLAAVYATLLDEGTYLASQRTMYPMAGFATLLGLGAVQAPTTTDQILSPLTPGKETRRRGRATGQTSVRFPNAPPDPPKAGSLATGGLPPAAAAGRLQADAGVLGAVVPGQPD